MVHSPRKGVPTGRVDGARAWGNQSSVRWRERPCATRSVEGRQRWAVPGGRTSPVGVTGHRGTDALAASAMTTAQGHRARVAPRAGHGAPPGMSRPAAGAAWTELGGAVILTAPTVGRRPLSTSVADAGAHRD